jgi:hypothetical protein
VARYREEVEPALAQTLSQILKDYEHAVGTIRQRVEKTAEAPLRK